MEPVTHRHRHRRPARPLRRRHRPDHPQRLAQAGRAHRLRQGPVLRVARRPRVRPQPGAVRRGQHPRGRPQLRHRLQSGSTPCGRSWTTASRPWSRPASPTSSATTAPRTAWCRWSCRPRWPRQLLRAVEADPTLEITVDVETPHVSRVPALGIDVDVPARRLHPGAVPARASTTSASPSATRPTSPPSRPPARPGCPPPPRPPDPVAHIVSDNRHDVSQLESCQDPSGSPDVGTRHLVSHWGFAGVVGNRGGSPVVQDGHDDTTGMAEVDRRRRPSAGGRGGGVHRRRVRRRRAGRPDRSTSGRCASSPTTPATACSTGSTPRPRPGSAPTGWRAAGPPDGRRSSIRPARATAPGPAPSAPPPTSAPDRGRRELDHQHPGAGHRRARPGLDRRHPPRDRRDRAPRGRRPRCRRRDRTLDLTDGGDDGTHSPSDCWSRATTPSSSSAAYGAGAYDGPHRPTAVSRRSMPSGDAASTRADPRRPRRHPAVVGCGDRRRPTTSTPAWSTAWCARWCAPPPPTSASSTRRAAAPAAIERAADGQPRGRRRQHPRRLAAHDDRGGRGPGGHDHRGGRVPRRRPPRRVRRLRHRDRAGPRPRCRGGRAAARRPRWSPTPRPSTPRPTPSTWRRRGTRWPTRADDGTTATTEPSPRAAPDPHRRARLLAARPTPPPATRPRARCRAPCSTSSPSPSTTATCGWPRPSSPSGPWTQPATERQRPAPSADQPDGQREPDHRAAPARRHARPDRRGRRAWARPSRSGASGSPVPRPTS